MKQPPLSLASVIHAIRRYLRRIAGTALGFGSVTVVGGILVLAWLLVGSDGWRPGTVVPLFLLIGGGVMAGTLFGWVLLHLRSCTSEVSLANQIEKIVRLPEGLVRAQVELARSVPQGMSSSLARAGERALLLRLSGGVDRLAGSPGKKFVRLFRVSAVGTGVVVALLVALVALTPDRTRTAWAGLARPVELLTPEPLPPLELFPGDGQLPRGESPRVEVGAEGRDSVWVHWQAIGDVLRERSLMVVDGRAETFLPELEVEVRYWASSPDGAVTPVSTLIPSDPSLLSSLALDVEYPPYTRLPPESFRRVPAWLSVPEGTVINLAGRVEGQGSEVLLLGEGGQVAIRLSVEDGHFSGRWRPTRSELITWAVESGQEGATLPQTLDLEVIPDAAPELSLPVPGADGELPLSLRVPLLLEASDDYGVAWAEVETVHQRPGEEDVVGVDHIPTGNLAQVTLRPMLDFSAWGIRPGDAILLKARVSDNAPVGQVVETITYRLAMRAATEVREAARARIEDVTSRTEELLDRVSRETAELRNLERQSRFGPQQAGGDRDELNAFEDREELRQALERQEDLAAEIDQITSGLEEASRALAEMAERDNEDADLRERIEELESLLEEVLGPEARDRLEELQEGFRQGELQEAPTQLLEELAQRQEDLQVRLEQALEQLRRSAIEEGLRGAEEQIRSLLQTQEALVEQMAQGEGEEAQREQAERTATVEEQLSELGEELSTSGNSEAADQTEAARRELGEAREAMTRAADSSQTGDREEAVQQASEAQESLQSAAQQLEETSSGFAENPEEEMQEGLRRGAQDALALARRQGQLREDLQNALPGERGDFEDEELAIMEGLQNLASELAEATQEQPDLASSLSEAIAASEEAVGQTVDAMARNGSQRDSEGLADAAQAAMNQVALAALEGLGQGGENSQSTESTDISEELSSLGDQQASLNEQGSRLSQESDQGGTPSDMELEDLVSGQQGIAGILQELGRRPGPGRTRNNLDALADESEEIAEELRQGRLDATILRRQEEFLERLLSAGRTLEQDAPTEEREATSAEAVPRRAVTALPEALLNPLALPLPSMVELGVLSPAQRRLVLDYFERVNRRRAAEGGR